MNIDSFLNIFKRSRPVLRRLNSSYILLMSTGRESTEWTTERHCLFGIDVDQRPMYFVSSAVKSKLNLQANDNFSPPELVNGVLYNVVNTSECRQDLVKSRITNSLLKERLNEISCEAAICSSFRLCTETHTFQSGFTVKFEENGTSINHEQYIKTKVINVAKSFGFTSISKLVPYSPRGFLVDVISCETNASVDHFEIVSVEYSGHHPSFDNGHSVFKSIEEVQHVLELGSKHVPFPEIEKLKNFAKTLYTNKHSGNIATEKRPHPFIVVEGLDAVGKSTLVGKLGERFGAEIFRSPPSCIASYRELFCKQCQPVERAFYSLGNYLIAEDIKEAVVKCPVVLDRFWYSSAAYAIAKEVKCGDESNIPPKGHPIYQWPSDLLKPSAVIFLVLDEEERQARIRQRGCSETNEETMLSKNRLLRKRLMEAYKNMDDPACIIIDASKNEEGVCDDVMTSLKQKKILT